jgi:hypothetical protein
MPQLFHGCFLSDPLQFASHLTIRRCIVQIPTGSQNKPCSKCIVIYTLVSQVVSCLTFPTTFLMHLSSLPRLVLLDFPCNILPRYTTSGDVRAMFILLCNFRSNKHLASHARDARARVGHHVTCPLLFDFSPNWSLSVHFNKFSQMSDFVRMCSAVLELCRADGPTSRCEHGSHNVSHYELNHDDKVGGSLCRLRLFNCEKAGSISTLAAHRNNFLFRKLYCINNSFFVRRKRRLILSERKQLYEVPTKQCVTSFHTTVDA